MSRSARGRASLATLGLIAARGPTVAHTGGPGRGRGPGSRRACASGPKRRALRRPAPPAGEDARDADGGRRTTGAACPARRGTGAWRRRPGSGAAVRGSRGEPSSRMRPPPRRRRRSCVTPLAKTPQETRNPAACTRLGGAVGGHARRPMGYPAPVGRRTLARVARPAQHRGVADVERRTASGERDDVIDGQITRGVGRTLVARAPVAMLTTSGAEHAGAESLPGPRAVEVVVPAAVGLSGVLEAATARAAGDDTTDRAQLHP